MTSEQKYEGKANNANPVEQTAQDSAQAAETGPSTVKPNLSANTFTFEELLMFDSLPDSGKTIIATLVNSGSYQPEQLSRVLLYVSTRPEVTAIDDESLQAVLTQPVDQQPFTIAGSKEIGPIEPIMVKLPFFLVWQIRDAERTKNLLGAINRVFEEFSRSETGKKIDEEDFNQTLAYNALRFNFSEIVEKAAKQAGTYSKPKGTDYLFDMPALAIDDPELANSPVVLNNAQDCTDIAQLQEWVSTLQQMAVLQSKAFSIRKEIDSVVEQQQQTITRLEQVVAEHGQQIATYKEKLEKQRTEIVPPTAKSTVELVLSIDDDFRTSTANVVFYALSEFREEALKRSFESLYQGEQDNAHSALCQYEQARGLLDELTSKLMVLSDSNYWANSANYVGAYKQRQNSEKASFEYFQRQYLNIDPNDTSDADAVDAQLGAQAE